MAAALALLLVWGAAGCGGSGVAGGASGAASEGPGSSAGAGLPKVLAVETFLADIAQNVAGDRLQVQALMPAGVDPHSFEPTPADIGKVAGCSVLVVNGAGFESFLGRLLQNAGGTRAVIEASSGLAGSGPRAGDPHFWLDPTLVVTYVRNIRDGLSAADPAGVAAYTANAAAYITKLEALDAWIRERVGTIPTERRLLVTNHESLGYFADRYGFRVVGEVIPSVSTGASPSAQQLAHLVDVIRETSAPAIFLETGANPQLAEQVAAETGARVVTNLYTHSVTEPGGPAPTYLDMMHANVDAIVAALG
jgi:ABC-type Zn uptake system ZnuABC Zn-binding protein ZnuA